jgi:hypothetical protein
MVAVGTGSAGHCRSGKGRDGWQLLAGDDLGVIGGHVPSGAARQMRTDVRFLVMSAPESHGDRVAAPADGVP